VVSLRQTIRPLEQAIARLRSLGQGWAGHPSRLLRLFSPSSFARVPAHRRIDDVTQWASRNRCVCSHGTLLVEEAPPMVHQLVAQGPGHSAVPVEGGLPSPESLKSVLKTNGSDS